MNCILSRHVSVDTVFQNLWFLSGFLDRWLMLTWELLHQVLVVKWKIPFRQFYVFHHDLVNLYGNKSQIRPPVLSRKLLRILTGTTRWVSLVRIRKCLLFRNSRIHPRCLWSLLYHCLTFFFSFGHCIVCPSVYRLSL